MLETERLKLRALTSADLPKRVEWLNNSIVRETLLLRFPLSIDETNIWFENTLKDPSRVDFIIEVKESGDPIGFAGYVGLDWIHRKAEPFIAIGETSAWGKGYGTEVVHLLLDYGFNELGLNRMYGYMLDNNPGALKMDLKAGFNEEGILKQDVLIHGEYHDRIMLGVTRGDFNRRFNNGKTRTNNS